MPSIALSASHKEDDHLLCEGVPVSLAFGRCSVRIPSHFSWFSSVCLPDKRGDTGCLRAFDFSKLVRIVLNMKFHNKLYTELVESRFTPSYPVFPRTISSDS
jgi:hypothetical protein